jgi:hypothetical protein
MAKCTRCGTPIPDINVEFGGTHTYNLDGDLYCGTGCLGYGSPKKRKSGNKKVKKGKKS